MTKNQEHGQNGQNGQLFSDNTEYLPNRSTMSPTDESCDRGFLNFLAYVRGEKANARVDDPTLMEEDVVDRRAEVSVPGKHERTGMMPKKMTLIPKAKVAGCYVIFKNIWYSIFGSKSRKNTNGLRWWHAIFFFSSISVLVCLLQILLPPPFGMLMTSAEVSELGIASGGCADGLKMCICPRKTVCATDITSLILLTIARCSAFFDYPLYMMMFLSKCHNLNNILRRTVLREFIDFADMHRIHSMFGVAVGVETISHSFFHIMRWGINRDIRLLWKTRTGITGAIVCATTVVIVWPMFLPSLKKRIPFEVRKAVHYLFLVWALLLMWHAPSRIFWLIGVPFAFYLADFFVGIFVRTHLIENVHFERYGQNGVALHFENPKGFSGSKTSYVYIMCPWISKWQWHAFTIFPEPTKKDHTIICIGSSGDWTKEMYNKIRSPCHRSVFVLGPFASEFSDMAVNTTNAIAIASGIGITPTISLVNSYAGKKRINIIWMCRDPGLIEYLLHKVDIAEVTRNSFVVIHYTGKPELVLPKNNPSNFFIFRSRPNLEKTISGIVTAIVSGKGLPEDIYEYQRAFADISFDERIKIAFSRVNTIYSTKTMFDYAVIATERFDYAGEANATGVDEIDLENCSKGLLSRDTIGQIACRRASLSSFNGHVSHASVNVVGLEAMMERFLGGVGEYSQADVQNLFKLVDTDHSGYIDRDEFDEFVDLATGSDTPKCKSLIDLSDRKFGLDAIVLGDDSTISYMESMVGDVEHPLDDWSMFYCGNAIPIVRDLQCIERKYHIGLGIEKFDW